MRAVVVTLAVAALCYGGVLFGLYLFQTRLIYPGWSRGGGAPAMDMAGWRDVALVAEDGAAGRLLYSPPRPGMPVILFFHGNGDTVAGGAAAVAPYRAAGFGVVLPEYRGYAGLPGKPSEAGLYRDARAARRWMAAHGIGADRTVIIGYSLGSGVAAESALASPPRALALVAAFASVPRVTAQHFPWIPARWLVTERFDTFAKIARIRCPLLLVHGEADGTIPPDNSRLLGDARPDARLVLLPGLGHELVWRPAAQRAISRWLAALPNGQ